MTSTGSRIRLQIAAAYNAGPSRVQAAVKAELVQTLPAETWAYIVRMAKVLPKVRDRRRLAKPAETGSTSSGRRQHATSDVEQPFAARKTRAM